MLISYLSLLLSFVSLLFFHLSFSVALLCVLFFSSVPLFSHMCPWYPLIFVLIVLLLLLVILLQVSALPLWPLKNILSLCHCCNPLRSCWTSKYVLIVLLCVLCVLVVFSLYLCFSSCSKLSIHVHQKVLVRTKSIFSYPTIMEKDICTSNSSGSVFIMNILHITNTL